VSFPSGCFLQPALSLVNQQQQAKAFKTRYQVKQPVCKQNKKLVCLLSEIFSGIYFNAANNSTQQIILPFSAAEPKIHAK